MIVLSYVLCGILFFVVRAISAAILRHYVRGMPERDDSIGAYVLDFAIWPVSFLVWVVAWSVIVAKAVSAYLTARRLGL
jgi:hypothetical protein